MFLLNRRKKYLPSSHKTKYNPTNNIIIFSLKNFKPKKEKQNK